MPDYGTSTTPHRLRGLSVVSTYFAGINYVFTPLGIIEPVRNRNAIPIVHRLNRHLAIARRSEVLDNA